MTDTATTPRYEAQFKEKARYSMTQANPAPKVDRIVVHYNHENPDGKIFRTTHMNLSVSEATELVASLRTALAVGRLINEVNDGNEDTA